MRLKSDFRRRLLRLNRAINWTLETDSQGCVCFGDLFSSFFSVFSFVWSQKSEKLFKK